jgi:hypothetical protein
MTIGLRVLSIQEFLLNYVVGGGAEIDDPHEPVPFLGADKPLARSAPGDAVSFRAEIERHNDRTMTVVFHDRVETITRCGVCPKEATRPCTALRRLAMPYVRHPAYRPEWAVTQPDATGDPDQEGSRPRTEEFAFLPYQRVADLPPPGNARRRILRLLGISFRESDYTEDELAARGIAGQVPVELPVDSAEPESLPPAVASEAVRE